MVVIQLGRENRQRKWEIGEIQINFHFQLQIKLNSPKFVEINSIFLTHPSCLVSLPTVNRFPRHLSLSINQEYRQLQH